MRRHDQYPCEFDEFEALHCCFANAVTIGSEKNVTASAVRTVEQTFFAMTRTVKIFCRAIDARASVSIALVKKYSFLLAQLAY